MNTAVTLLLSAPTPTIGGSGQAPSAATPVSIPVSSPDVGANGVPNPTLWAQVATANGIPPALLQALTTVESGNNPDAVSSAGAIGLTQLMPETAATLGVDANNPTQNLEGGAAYLAQQLQTFHGNIELALAAYNAGPAAVEAYGGVPPYSQTVQYVQDVMALYQQYSQG